MITLALVLMGITMILTGLAQSFGFAFLMRLLTGFGNGAAYVPAMTLAAAWFVDEAAGFRDRDCRGRNRRRDIYSGLIVPSILRTYGQEGWRFCLGLPGFCRTILAGLVYVFVRSRPEEKGLMPIGI